MTVDEYAQTLTDKQRDTLATYGKHCQWQRIMRATGLDLDKARELGCLLRGKALAVRGGYTQAPPKMASSASPTPTIAKPDDSNGKQSQVTLEAGDDELVAMAKGATIRTLDELLEAADVDRHTWIVKKWVANKWDGQVTGGAPIELWQVKAWLERRPPWAQQPVQAIKHQRRKLSTVSAQTDAALIIPDSQIGYRWRGKHDLLDPLHDRRAWDIAIQVAQRLKPATILLLGDMLDLAPWSTKYARDANLHNTTQPALAELHWWLGQLRLASPAARIIYLEGNHEARIAKALRQLLSEADGVAPVNDEDGEPALSVPRLLALETLDIEYVGPYDAEHWLWEAVRVHHGDTVRRRGGATVAEVVRDADSHEVVGHIHRLELACKTINNHDGQQVRWALSPGTLSRIDGIVPAGTTKVDWQQGLAVIERTSDGLVLPMLVPIQQGKALYCRELLVGDDRSAEISDSTGWGFA